MTYNVNLGDHGANTVPQANLDVCNIFGRYTHHKINKLNMYQCTPLDYGMVVVCKIYMETKDTTTKTGSNIQPALQ
jgi:hypothetical protein